MKRLFKLNRSLFVGSLLTALLLTHPLGWTSAIAHTPEEYRIHIANVMHP